MELLLATQRVRLIFADRARPGRGAYSWTEASTGAGGTYTVLTGAGTGGTVTFDGDDQQGSVTVVTGTSPAAGSVFTAYFRVPWPNTPRALLLTPANSATAALTGAQQVWAGDAANSHLHRTYWRLRTGATPLTASTTYKWHYQVLP